MRFSITSFLFAKHITQRVGNPDAQRGKGWSDGDEGDEEVIVIGHEHGRHREDDVDEVGQVEHCAAPPSVNDQAVMLSVIVEP